MTPRWFSQPAALSPRSARHLTLNTKVVVTVSGTITSIGERNFLAIGGAYGTALVASFNTEAAADESQVRESALISKVAQSHKNAAATNGVATAIAPAFLNSRDDITLAYLFAVIWGVGFGQYYSLVSACYFFLVPAGKLFPVQRLISCLFGLLIAF